MSISRAKRAAIDTLKKYEFIVPTQVDKIVESEGIYIREEDLEDTVSGMLVIKDEYPIIVVNANHHRRRKRFTIAHELGHYLLHRNIASIFFDESLVFFRDNESSTGTKYQEIEANSFAAELLMPASALRERLSKNPLDALDENDDSGIRKLAQEFDVSVQALTIRLTRLGFISD